MQDKAPTGLFPNALWIDTKNDTVWLGNRQIGLTPKAFALLRHLVEHPQQVLSKKQLLEAVWGATQVNTGVLKTHLQTPRKALGDDPRSPHRRNASPTWAPIYRAG